MISFSDRFSPASFMSFYPGIFHERASVVEEIPQLFMKKNLASAEVGWERINFRSISAFLKFPYLGNRRKRALAYRL
jgi:hypothetical protein